MIKKYDNDDRLWIAVWGVGESSENECTCMNTCSSRTFNELSSAADIKIPYITRETKLGLHSQSNDNSRHTSFVERQLDTENLKRVSRTMSFDAPSAGP
jgi:hypothetical protein